MKEAEDLPQNKSLLESEFFSNFKSLFDKIFNFSHQIGTLPGRWQFPISNKIPFSGSKSFFESFRKKTKHLLLIFFFKLRLENFKYIFSGTGSFLKKSGSVIGYFCLAAFRKLIEITGKIKIPPTHFRKKEDTSKLGFLPDFGKIKNIFSKFSYEQKIYTVLILLLIFFVPYLGIKIEKRIAEKKVAEIARNAPKEIIPLEQDKNVIRISNLNTISQSETTISRIINLNGKMFFIGNSGIFDLEKNRLFSYPSEIGTIRNSAGMNDLNLILLITEDKKAFSFSPTSEKFQSNSVELSSESNITCGETYLTYLYLLDSQNNQIYRYPRAEGGFGAKIDWLKDGTDLSGVSNISVNENIFAVSPNEIIKLFKGKRQDFSVSETATPIIYDDLYVAKSNLEMYILDKTNSRIIRLDQEGNILNQYYNEKIKNTSAFSIDEEKNIIYFAVNDKVYSFLMTND
jgi:hypothetical protein